MAEWSEFLSAVGNRVVWHAAAAVRERDNRRIFDALLLLLFFGLMAFLL
jgi:hypothetical protein